MAIMVFLNITTNTVIAENFKTRGGQTKEKKENLVAASFDINNNLNQADGAMI